MVEPSTPCRAAHLRSSQAAPHGRSSAPEVRSWPETSPNRYSPHADRPPAGQRAVAGGRSIPQGSLRGRTATRSCRRNDQALSAPGWRRSVPATPPWCRRRPRCWNKDSSTETSQWTLLFFRRCRDSILTQERFEILPHRLECLLEVFPDRTDECGILWHPLLTVEPLSFRNRPGILNHPTRTGIDILPGGETLEDEVAIVRTYHTSASQNIP